MKRRKKIVTTGYRLEKYNEVTYVDDEDVPRKPSKNDQKKLDLCGAIHVWLLQHEDTSRANGKGWFKASEIKHKAHLSESRPTINKRLLDLIVARQVIRKPVEEKYAPGESHAVWYYKAVSDKII